MLQQRRRRRRAAARRPAATAAAGSYDGGGWLRRLPTYAFLGGLRLPDARLRYRCAVVTALNLRESMADRTSAPVSTAS
jgi:hypothetical protein